MILCNGVFEGGGVRGIGHVGAACGMEQGGYRFVELAGSSAGALVAALLAAGYRCGELRKEMETLDYLRFKGKDLADYFGTVGKLLSLLFTLGIYNTDYLEQWMMQMLEVKGIRTFGDVERQGRRLWITVSDLTERRILVFPRDAELFGMEPETFPVAQAVRMSASIPVFFEPFRLRDRWGREHMLVDGGLLSNHPMWTLDNGITAPMRPTFGFRFRDKKNDSGSSACMAEPNLADYLKSIVSTCLDAIDNNYVSRGDYDRTIWIPTVVNVEGKEKKISATDFEITGEESGALFENGFSAAEGFLKTWNFQRWKTYYREKKQAAW